jgi:hypothetical protein
MKQLRYFFLLTAMHGDVHSQQKLQNGIYVIDQSVNRRHVARFPHKTAVPFNPLFVDDDPELYDPIVISTDDYVPLDLSSVSVVESEPFHKKMLQLQLTDSATKKLTTFTSAIPQKYVVIVVNGAALTIHKIQEPVTSGMIVLMKDRVSAYEQICRTLKKTTVSK